MKTLYKKLSEEDCGLDEVRRYGILDKVVRIAYDAYIENCADGVCEITEEGYLEGHTYSGNSYNRDNNIALYRFEANWIAQNCWDNPNMLLYDEEWKELQEKYGEEADFTDREQVESIGIDFDDRLVEYAIWEIEAEI